MLRCRVSVAMPTRRVLRMWCDSDKLHDTPHMLPVLYHQLIEPVAKAVGVSMDNVYANVLRFEDTGEGKFIDHDPEQPTSRSRGKPKVIAQLKDKHGYKTTVMVGDGGTDKEARPPADAFIGYGGKVRRTGIAEGADWFVWDFGEMIDVLE